MALWKSRQRSGTNGRGVQRRASLLSVDFHALSSCRIPAAQSPLCPSAQSEQRAHLTSVCVVCRVGTRQILPSPSPSMPPRVVGPPRKEACILILDVGASMGRAEDDGRESKLLKAQKSVQLRQTHNRAAQAGTSAHRQNLSRLRNRALTVRGLLPLSFARLQ